MSNKSQKNLAEVARWSLETPDGIFGGNVLTDAALKNLKPKPKGYKVTDRDGMYVYVSHGGTITFRLDYRLNGRRDTLHLGR